METVKDLGGDSNCAKIEQTAISNKDSFIPTCNKEVRFHLLSFSFLCFSNEKQLAKKSTQKDTNLWDPCQCDNSIARCWCVDAQTSQVMAGTNEEIEEGENRDDVCGALNCENKKLDENGNVVEIDGSSSTRLGIKYFGLFMALFMMLIISS